MIAGTYLGSAAVAALMAVLFTGHALGGSPWTFQAFIFGTFFLASAGASAAYLTVSEIFPMETRALAIAFFYAVGTGIGGIIGPLLFGNLIASGNRGEVATAFYIGAAVMALGGIAELLFGVKAEQVPLENIAKPLTAEEAEQIARARARGTAPLPAGAGPGVSVLLAGPHGDVSPAADGGGRAAARGRGDRTRRRRGRPDLPGRALPHGRSAALGAGPLPAGARRSRRGRPDPACRARPVRSP